MRPVSGAAGVGALIVAEGTAKMRDAKGLGPILAESLGASEQRRAAANLAASFGGDRLTATVRSMDALQRAKKGPKSLGHKATRAQT